MPDEVVPARPLYGTPQNRRRCVALCSEPGGAPLISAGGLSNCAAVQTPGSRRFLPAEATGAVHEPPFLLPHYSSERDAYPHLISVKRTPGTVACDDNDKPCWSPALTIAGVRGICDGSDEKSRKSGVLRLKVNLREDDRPDKFGFLPHGPPGVLISTQTWTWSLR